MINQRFFRTIAISLLTLFATYSNTFSAYGQSECDAFINVCNIPSSFSTWTLVRAVNHNTAEAGEPVPHTFYTAAQNPITTEWYHWTAPLNGTVIVDTAGTNPNALPLLYRTPFNVDTLTAVYTGTALNNLVRVDESDNWFVNNPPDSSCAFQRPIPESFYSSCMQFTVLAGTTYHFQMDHLANPQTLPSSQFYLNLRYFVITAASVSISGRVTNANGSGVSRTTVSLTDLSGNTRTALTNPFGYYRFTDIETGQIYTLEARRKGYQFENNPRLINISDNLEGEDFVVSNSLSKRE